MKKIVLTLMSLFVAIILVNAQEDSKPGKYSYSNITEFGFTTTSPQSIAFEATTVHGFALNKQHCIGFGVGFGLSSYIGTGSTVTALYTPMYFNYRVYFKPEKTFSPHINLAAGGVMVDKGQGIMASITSGFKSKHFSLSSGLSFMAINREREYMGYEYYDYAGNYIHYPGEPYREWIYPFGVTIKVGFTF